MNKMEYYVLNRVLVERFRSLTLPKSIIYDFKTLADIDVHFWHSRPDKDVVLHLSGLFHKSHMRNMMQEHND